MANDSILIQVQLGSPTKANVNAVTRQIQNSLSNVSANVEIKNGRQATQTLQTVKKGTDAASRSMNSFGEAIGLSARRFLAFTSAVAVVGRLTSAISQATREAIKFEREFVKLAQVFDTDVKALGRLQNSISDLAQEFGLSANVIAKTSVVLAQSGLNAKETEKAMRTLAKTTLAATFDNIASSAEGAVAIMSQFETQADQLEAQLGAINAVSKRFAVESADIIEAVRRAGGAFKAAGGNLNDFIALFTAVRSTTRESAETIATGFRTIFARLQRPKVIDYFRELNIELTNGAGQFVGAFEAVRRLSEGLNRLGIEAGDIKFAEIVEQLGGIRQVSRVIPLLREFTKAEQARQVAQQGAASLDADAAKAQETLAQAFARTTENFRALIREITQTGTFQAFVKIALSMANAFIEAARAIKPLIPLIAALSAIKLGGLLSGALKKGFGGAGGTGGLGQGFKRGGPVPGTGNGDTVPAMLEPGEFVIRKSAVQAFGVDRLSKINKYAKGGVTTKEPITATGKQISTVYPSLNNKVGVDEPYSANVIKHMLPDSVDKKGAMPAITAKVINAMKGEGGLMWQRFEKAIPKVIKTGPNASGNAALDYKRDPGDAKFLKYGTVYRGQDESGGGRGKGNNAITMLAKLLADQGVDTETKDVHVYYPENPKQIAAIVKKGKTPITTSGQPPKKMANGGAVSVRDAVARYSSNSAEVNTGQTDRRTNKLRSELDSIMGQDEVPALLFSGIGQTRKKLIEDQIGGPINQEAIGKTFSLPGFLSTSSNSAIAGRFVNKSTGGKGGIGYILEITTKGRGINVSGKEEAHYEKESILPRNSKFQINSVGLSRHGFNVGVKELAKGGPAGTDTVPALLTPGEFVINKKSAEAFGYNGLEKINKYASGGPVGVQRFNVGGGVGINRSELFLKLILDELRNMNSLGGGGGGGETDENIDTIKQESKERENLTSIVGESFAQQQKYSLALTASTAGLALFSGSLGPTFAPLTELLTKTTVNFGFFNAGLGAGQKAAAKIAGGFEKMGISNPADTFEKLKSKTQEAGNSIKEMFKSKGTKEKEKTAGILDQIRKGGAVDSKTDGAKPTGAKEQIIKSATIQIKQAEIKVDGQKGEEKEKYEMPSMAKPPETYGLESAQQEAARLADKAGTYALKPATDEPKAEETASQRKFRRTGQAQIANLEGRGGGGGKAETGQKSPIMDQLRKDLSGLGKDLRKVGTASRTVFMSLSRIPAVGPALGAVGAAATAVAGGLGVAAKGALALGKAGVKGGAKLLKSTGKALTKGLGKTAKAAAGALGGIAEAGTSAVGLFASAMAAVASQEAETAAKRKEDAIKEGDIKATVAAFEQESAAQFRSAAITSGASAGAGIGTAIGALLIPVLGPLGPVIGSLIGSIGGLVAGLAVGEEFLNMLADGAREGASMFLTGINIIVQGINDYFLKPLSDAINYIYSWVTGEELDVNIEVPKVSGKVATALLNAIPDPALTKQLEKAQAIHAASLSKYTRTQDAANKAVEDSMKSFLVADDAATKISSLNDAIDSAASKLTGTEGIELISKEDIAAQKAKLKKLRADQAAGSAAGGDDAFTGLTGGVDAQREEIENLTQTIQQNEEAYKAQQEAIAQSSEHFGQIFEASRNAGFLAQTLAKANNQQKLAIDASGVITAASLKEGSALKASFEARVRADTSMRPIEEKQRSALLAMTQEIFGVNGALGEMKKATEKAYQTVGAELKTLAFGSEQERAGSAQKVLASAAVASGQVKINDLSDDAKKGALSFLPALANAGISDFGGGNIMESLTANVADTIPGFDQIGQQAYDDTLLRTGGDVDAAAAAQKEEQDRLVKAMFGIDDTAMKQLQAAQESLAVQRKILEAQTGQKEETTVPADPKQGENGPEAVKQAAKAAADAAFKGDIKAAAAASDGELKKDSEAIPQIQDASETIDQVQTSVLDEAKKQTVLLAAILAKPVAGGVAGAQGSLAKDVNAAYDTAKSAASTAVSYTPLGVVRNTLGFGEDDGSGMRIGDLFGGEGEKKRMARIKREKAGEALQARNREKYGQPAGAKAPTSAGAGGVDQKQVQDIIASLGKGSVGAGTITSPDLIEAANKIKEASEIFPKEIQMTLGDTSVNVNVNGAEVLNAIMPEVKSVVMNSVVNELISFEQTKDQNNSPGSYANNKKAEQYNA